MRFTLMALALLVAALPAAAWGPRAQLALVSTASNLVGKQQNIPLNRLSREVVNGASVARIQLVEQFPDLASDPLRAIESEMYLLQAVKPSRLDPYYAYRLGTLGKLIAEVTSPLGDADPAYRDLFFADVERAIDDLALSASTFRIVEPMAYLREVVMLQNQRNALIEQDYRQGSGFEGVARSALREYASNSVSAVGNIWFTILGSGARAAVSQEVLSDYALGALEFYASRDNVGELDAAVERLAEVTPLTGDLKLRFADVYFESGYDDRAIRLYQEVAAAEPSRRDVSERIAQYYVKQGRTALEKDQLEPALEAFAQAVAAFPLHPTAEKERLDVAKLIDERNARHALTRQAAAEAGQLQALAEAEALSQHYAESIALMRQALELLGTVDPEFPVEYTQAQTSTRNLQLQIRDMRERLVQNAQSFSGSAVGEDVRMIAGQQTEALGRATLEALEMQARAAEIAALRQQLESGAE